MQPLLRNNVWLTVRTSLYIKSSSWALPVRMAGWGEDTRLFCEIGVDGSVVV